MTYAKQMTYEDLKARGIVENVKEAIYMMLSQPMTVDDLENELIVKRSTITARLSDLNDEGRIKVDRTIKTDTGRLNSLYVRTSKSERKQIEQRRHQEKINRYIYFLENNGYKVIK